jgi:uncharacterized BrkB/YihY/UPF0761 family membrane protein
VLLHALLLVLLTGLLLVLLVVVLLDQIFLKNHYILVSHLLENCGKQLLAFNTYNVVVFFFLLTLSFFVDFL